MKRIFADLLTKDWYAVFVDLSMVIRRRAFTPFACEFDEENSDIIILNSFEELIDKVELFSEFINRRNEENNPVIFIIKTKSGSTEKNSLKCFLHISDYFFICDLDLIYELILTILPPHEIERETLLADKPKLVCPFDLRMWFTMQWDYLEPVFDDGL